MKQCCARKSTCDLEKSCSALSQTFLFVSTTLLRDTYKKHTLKQTENCAMAKFCQNEQYTYVKMFANFGDCFGPLHIWKKSHSNSLATATVVRPFVAFPWSWLTRKVTPISVPLSSKSKQIDSTCKFDMKMIRLTLSHTINKQNQTNTHADVSKQP